MHTGYNTHARELDRIARQRTWRIAQLFGLAMLAGVTLVVVFLALTRQS
jgi:hypothetical protein